MKVLREYFELPSGLFLEQLKGNDGLIPVALPMTERQKEWKVETLMFSLVCAEILFLRLLAASFVKKPAEGFRTKEKKCSFKA